MSSALASLRAHAARLRPLAELNLEHPARAQEHALRVGPLYANFARQSYDDAALQALWAWGGQVDLSAALRRQMGGEIVNATEQRPALHTALRGDTCDTPAAHAAHAQAHEALQRMRVLVDALVASEVTDIISIGIGGSDLGPRLVADALATADARFRVHFLSNVDGHAARRLLARLDPARSAAIVISKSFGTQETLLNGRIVRDWLGDDSRLHAASANLDKAAAFGIPAQRLLPMWDWVGGRYSLWSAVGFPIALAIGMDRFEALLAGAAEMDAHALQAAPPRNLAMWHALTAAWNRNVLGLASQAVVPYDERLRLLPAYLQQLAMESLGKRVQVDGSAVADDTVPVWWGGPGSDVQHSFFQALHQGTSVVPIDFIGVVHADHGHAENHAALLANLLAQAEALANGAGSDDAHRQYPGNRPSTLLLLDALTPQSLGMLIALYEHSVYLQSVLWGINAFDQFGVELGKRLADGLLPALRGETSAADPVTAAVLAQIRSSG